ncbi:MAG: DUF7800 domain-containing protein, partial [Candidatus Kariarchaeaceae archaeon]
MRSRRITRKLALGPIVGHTDYSSTRIWIQVFDDPANYYVRVRRHGVFPFQSTEGQVQEFGTAVALIDGLRPDKKYDYEIIRKRRMIRGRQGSFRTMPSLNSPANVMFVSVSCSDPEHAGAWPDLRRFIEQNNPHFLIMMGDQVYMDQRPNLWEEHFDSPRVVRREAMVDKYHQHWDREPIRTIMANIPTYM